MTIPELKTITITEALPDNPGHDYDFTGNYTDAGGTVHSVEVFDTTYFVQNIIQLFRTRKITLPEEDPATALKALFDSWKASRSELYLKQAYAYTLRYNPIENYSSREQMTDDITTHEKGSGQRTEYNNFKDSLEITPFTKETTTETPYTKITEETTPYTKETTETHPYTKETTETRPYTAETTTTSGIEGSSAPTSETSNSMRAFNSNSWVDTNKSTTDINQQQEFVRTGTEKVESTKDGTEKVELTKTGTEKLETTWTGNKKLELEKEGKEKHETTKTGSMDIIGHGTDTDRHQYLLTKSGNIGVLTASEMLQREYEGLKQDLAFRALSEFIDRYTWYSAAVE